MTINPELGGLSPSFWGERPVLITGGASFIGSHLADALVTLGANVTVVDDLSSGKFENVEDHVRAGRIDFHNVDLRDEKNINHASRGVDTVFHLAADHGGRGYVDLHQAECAGNMLLDGLIFRAAQGNGVRKIVYASSGCVYPLYLQRDPTEDILLTEDLVGPPYEADGMYGWAKLMGEMTLRALHEGMGLRAVSCRYFTVYGPRGIENHAVIAMMARALIGQDPFVVWGDGKQVRNWTYVSDIVEGTLHAAEKVDDARAINLGTEERITVDRAARTILELAGVEAELEHQPNMPTGPQNRVASADLARELLDWEPRVSFDEGVRRTYEWYREAKTADELKEGLEARLTERGTIAR